MIRGAFASLDQSGAFDVPPASLAAIRASFDAHSVNEAATTDEITRTYREADYVLDPHTATGVRAARARLAVDPSTPVVALATAHPAKFPDAIERAIGARPRLPGDIAARLEGREHFTVLENDVARVAAFIAARARAAKA
jgi:threonine synthase